MSSVFQFLIRCLLIGGINLAVMGCSIEKNGEKNPSYDDRKPQSNSIVNLPTTEPEFRPIVRVDEVEPVVQAIDGPSFSGQSTPVIEEKTKKETEVINIIAIF